MDKAAPQSDVNSQPPSDNINTKVLVTILAFFVIASLYLVWKYNYSGAAIALAQAEARIACGKKIHAIAQAIQGYKDEHGSFPPAFTQDKSGRRLHSWRTLILPYLGENALYDKIDLSQPWDSEVNRTARETMVDAYQCTCELGSETLTSYFAVIFDDGIMTGPSQTKPEQMTDGLDNTILIVEGPPGKSISWIEPNDLSFREFLEFEWGSKMSHHVGGTHVTMADGKTFFITSSIDKQTLRAMLTASGGEPVDLGW